MSAPRYNAPPAPVVPTTAVIPLFPADRHDSFDSIRFRSIQIPGLEVVSSAYEDDVPAVSASDTHVKESTHAAHPGQQKQGGILQNASGTAVLYLNGVRGSGAQSMYNTDIVNTR